MPDCPKLDPEQMFIQTGFGLSTLTENVTLQALLIELDGLLGSLAATLSEGQVTTFEILNGTILNEDIADGTITINKLAPGVIPASVAGGASNDVPIGTVLAYAGAIPPAGFLLCDGSTQDSALYPQLAAVLGDGASSTFSAVATGYFALPDLRGRTIIGAGTGAYVSGGSLTARALGGRSGREAHTLVESEMPNHKHFIEFYLDDGGTGGVIPPLPLYGSHSAVPISGYPVVDRTSFWTEFTGGNGAHNNMQPFNTLSYIIRCDVPAPGAPTPATPGGAAPSGVTAIAVDTAFTWTAGSNATAYQIQVDDTSNAFGSIVYDATTSLLTATPTANLAAATQHWFRIRSLNPAGASDWTTVWDFTTA